MNTPDEQRKFYKEVFSELKDEDFVPQPPANERATRWLLILAISTVILVYALKPIVSFDGFPFTLQHVALFLISYLVLCPLINAVMRLVGFRYGYAESLLDPFYRSAQRVVRRQRDE